MWVPGPQLCIGAHIPLMRAWGFTPVAIAFTWIKLWPRSDPANFTLRDIAMGPGHTTRKNAEYVVLGRRGHRSLRADCGVHEVIISPRREHSRKPDEVYRRIMQYVGGESGGPFLELFARESRPGWQVWGDQTTLFDSREDKPR
jgi:N6-adenosine-specific RNA methylase IME4